jgi:hypothetical protein
LQKKTQTGLKALKRPLALKHKGEFFVLNYDTPKLRKTCFTHSTWLSVAATAGIYADISAIIVNIFAFIFFSLY